MAHIGILTRSCKARVFTRAFFRFGTVRLITVRSARSRSRQDFRIRRLPKLLASSATKIIDRFVLSFEKRASWPPRIQRRVGWRVAIPAKSKNRVSLEVARLSPPNLLSKRKRSRLGKIASLRLHSVTSYIGGKRWKFLIELFIFSVLHRLLPHPSGIVS